MSGNYKLTIPGNYGELADHIGWMALAGPDFAGGLPGRDIDAAFDELAGGIKNVAATLSTDAEAELRSAGAKVRGAFETDDLKTAIEELERMILILEPPERTVS